MDWSKKMILDFIDNYRQREILWNPKHPDHYNKDLKLIAWNEIASEFGKPMEECKKKMEYLLASLRREKMKMRRSSIGEKGGKGSNYKKSWFALESMRFLWEKKPPAKNSSKSSQSVTIEDEDLWEKKQSAKNSIKTIQPQSVRMEDEESCISLIFDEAYEGEFDENITIGRSISPIPIGDSKRIKLQTQEEEQSYAEQNYEENLEVAPQSPAAVDDASYFGYVVAFKLRGYNESVRCAIQRDILKLFCRASGGYYNNVAGEVYTETAELSDTPDSS